MDKINEVEGARSWEEAQVTEQCFGVNNTPIFIPNLYLRKDQPVVIIPLDEYNLLKKKVDEANKAISYAEEVRRLLSLLNDLGGMSEKMKAMVEQGKRLFK